jgi:hypothetical protein
MSAINDIWPIEAQGIAHGLPYAVLANPMGFRCGYVMVPTAHPLYGRGYSDRADGLPAFDDEWDYERTVQDLIRVHGGVTFAHDMPNAGLVRGWWFGFDCGHCDDGYDVALMSPDRQAREARGEGFGQFHSGPAWSREAVEAECRMLARQLVEFEVPDPRTDPRVKSILSAVSA